MTAGERAVELLTPSGTGAVSIIHIRRDAERVLTALTGRDAWAIGDARLCDLGGHDRGLAVRVGDDSAWLMPHGGTAVTHAVLQAAREAAGTASPASPGAVASHWPEARDAVEEAVLELMARASSPLAFTALMEQPRLWREAATADRQWTDADAERSRRMDRLLAPPTVVLAGPPNIGKSTLANALAGRTVSITDDAAGTTRDAPSVRLDLGGLVVVWHDAPGLRTDAEDPIEREAIERIGGLLQSADLLVAAADHDHDWPALPRPPDLRIALRPDLGARTDADLTASGRDGTGLAALATAVLDLLVPESDRRSTSPWDAGGQLRAASRQNPIDEMPQST